MAPTVGANGTGTANGGGSDGDSAGSGNAPSQEANSPPNVLVLGSVALVLLAFSVLMLLEVYRVFRKERQQILALTAQKAASRMSAEQAGGQTREKGQARQALLPPQETSPAPLTPPRWLVEAGLLPQDLGECPSEDAQEL